ncbi:hypothetical protein M758_4G170200 [Ceratodon purpureus]|uniref:Uncharacterized protein n=1 Tax=Ceratodon purpureus TaxID=3225 RepID=A0A8T0IBQ7_CERPU|nr:hypothetical protein KC19_4G168600 [Ceratodon purpureus]KAG0619858.1 hypothetical protein M758_4G170200 [Ceratodon purpureus]
MNLRLRGFICVSVSFLLFFTLSPFPRQCSLNLCEICKWWVRMTYGMRVCDE